MPKPRTHLTTDEARRLYLDLGLSIRQIAALKRVSIPVVHHRLIEGNVPRRTRGEAVKLRLAQLTSGE